VAMVQREVADRLAAALRGGRMDESALPTRLRTVALPAHAPGRDEAVKIVSALLSRRSHLSIVLAGPDADAYNGQQGDMWDAQKDMSLALLGALLALIVLYLTKRSRSRLTTPSSSGRMA